MLEMRDRLRTRIWCGRVAIAGAALLVLATGLCLFDGGGRHDDGTSQDLCMGMIVATLMVSLLAGPLVNGWVRPDPLRLMYAVSPHLPDPPPKRSPLS